MAATTEDTGLTPENAQEWLAKRGDILKMAIIDFNGHFGMGGPRAQRQFCEGMTDLQHFTEFVRQDIHLYPKRAYFGYAAKQCGECGAELEGTFDGTTIRVVSKEGEAACPYPNGMPAYSFEINVPSGRMVIANDLRSFFPKIERHLSVNYNLGQRALSLGYAAVNLGHGCVSNTSPSIFRLDADRIAIGRNGGEEIEAEDGSETFEHPHEGTRVGQVCTDLWWYSIADLEEIAAKGYAKKSLDTILDVSPGRYRITHLFHTLDDEDDYSGPQTFALIEHVEDTAT